jgi:hypothetical protein
MLASFNVNAQEKQSSCDWPVFPVAASSKPISEEAVIRIQQTATAREIVVRLGPAARDSGSGLFVLEWDMDDGGVYVVSTKSPCAIPMAIGIRKRDSKTQKQIKAPTTQR